jgi:GTP-binding protein
VTEREHVYTIMSASFLATAPTMSALRTLPADSPEVAFVGRSNVGKSSLINALVERKSLVRTSRTPGHTKALQFFDVVVRSKEGERSLRVVDLPGYGFARASQEERLRMTALMAAYLESREQLVATVQLIDARHTPTRDDQHMKAQLLSTTTNYIVAATKADKLPASKRKPAKLAIAQSLERAVDDIVLVSAEKPFGRAALWSRIWDALPTP